jgi:hypothetical protein
MFWHAALRLGKDRFILIDKITMKHHNMEAIFGQQIYFKNNKNRSLTFSN